MTTTTARARLAVAYGAQPAHALLRVEAARFHQVSPAHIVLVHECPRCGSDAHGRPRLLATAAVRHPAYVSLARAGDLSVVAVTDAGPVGVDVETEGAAGFAGFEGVALHPGERDATPDDPTRVWVRKEALLKAYGLGLAVDPSHVRLDDDGLVTWDSPHEPPGTVWLRDLAVPGHRAAVAILPLAGADVRGLSATVSRATTGATARGEARQAPEGRSGSGRRCSQTPKRSSSGLPATSAACASNIAVVTEP